MTFEQDHRADWLQVLRRYLGVSIVANLVWEFLQLPLYTLWETGTRKQQVLAVLHCTIGDAMIAGLSLLAALALFARRGRALVLLAFMRQASRSVSSTQSSANGEHQRARQLDLLGSDASGASERDGPGSALAMVRGSNFGAVDRGRQGALDRSGIRALVTG